MREDDLIAFAELKPGDTYMDIPSELRRYSDESFTDSAQGGEGKVKLPLHDSVEV